jgi:predicted nucleotidyltransferase
METRSLIANRYHTVTRAINREFRGMESDTQNSVYVGSYGRGTAINTSDIDILVDLPQSEYERYDRASGNGQSRLLQAVKNAIQTTYSRSDISADGQVVKIAFSDGMQFEILPAFRQIDWLGQWNGLYQYPDTNMGGNWLPANPKAEQGAMKKKNAESNGLFYDTCKHFRRVRDEKFSSYHLSGIVIDSFVYEAIGYWHWTHGGETSAPSGEYEQVLLRFLTNPNTLLSLLYFTTPGSEQVIKTEDSLDCLEKVVKYIAE